MQNENKNKNFNTTLTPKQVVLKPQKKMGLVKVIPKPTQTSTTKSWSQASNNSTNQAPIEPITFPQNPNKDSISVGEALQIINQDRKLTTNSNQSQNTTNNPSSPKTIPQSQTAAPIQTPNTTADGDNPESRPIPLPFN